MARGWDSNPITSCRFCNLRKPRCRDCQECRNCRAALHLIAPGGRGRPAPSVHPGHRRSTLPDLTLAARASSACSSPSTASPKPQPTSCARMWMRPTRAHTPREHRRARCRTPSPRRPADLQGVEVGLVAAAQIRGCSVPASMDVSMRSTAREAYPVARRYSTMAVAASRTLTRRLLERSR